MHRTRDSGLPDRPLAVPQMLEGPPREVLRHAAAGLDRAERLGRPVDMAAALVAMARAYAALDARVAAEDMARQALRWAHASGSPDLLVETLCELGESACAVAEDCAQGDLPAAHAARERARDAAFEVSVLVLRVADPHWEAKALLRASDILNRCGDHEDAARLQGRALQRAPRAGPDGH
jgi:tetratricopeptide (TPR) repeat protein